MNSEGLLLFQDTQSGEKQKVRGYTADDGLRLLRYLELSISPEATRIFRQAWSQYPLFYSAARFIDDVGVIYVGSIPEQMNPGLDKWGLMPLIEDRDDLFKERIKQVNEKMAQGLSLEEVMDGKTI